MTLRHPLVPSTHNVNYSIKKCITCIISVPYSHTVRSIPFIPIHFTSDTYYGHIFLPKLSLFPEDIYAQEIYVLFARISPCFTHHSHMQLHNKQSVVSIIVWQ